MPTFKGHLRDEELEAVIAYVKSFSREWKKKERHADSIELPERPEWMKSLDRSKSHAKSGKQTYTTHCAVCHGAEGKGDGPGGFALKDVWGFDIIPGDLSGEHHKSGDRAEYLFRAISTGRDGTPPQTRAPSARLPLGELRHQRQAATDEPLGAAPR